MEKGIFHRTELLVGSDGMERLRGLRVIVFGVGGVGSWCVEALARTGVGHLTIVDGDRVAESNVNRQLPATSATIEMPKVEVMKRRLLEIDPEADITALRMFYTEETAGQFDFDGYDYVVDAIDSLKDKALLIRRVCDSKATLVSSMGAALKCDPGKIDVAEFWKVEGCPLARALRKRFKREDAYPSRKFLCVYSREKAPLNPPLRGEEEPNTPNGSLMHITASFGLRLAALIING